MGNRGIEPGTSATAKFKVGLVDAMWQYGDGPIDRGLVCTEACKSRRLEQEVLEISLLPADPGAV